MFPRAQYLVGLVGWEVLEVLLSLLLLDPVMEEEEAEEGKGEGEVTLGRGRCYGKNCIAFHLAPL